MFKVKKIRVFQIFNLLEVHAEYEYMNIYHFKFTQQVIGSFEEDVINVSTRKHI